MRRVINNFISVLHSLARFSLLKIFHWKNFKFSLIERFSPSVVTEFNIGSHVSIGRRVRVHGGSKIKVRRGGKLEIGDNAKLNYYCIIVCRESIKIGEGTEFGPSVFMYDHDHDYRVGIKKEQFKSTPIVIGKNCWIGANTVILRGTVLGDNCVVGAGSIVRGEFPNDSVIIQKRSTEINGI